MHDFCRRRLLETLWSFSLRGLSLLWSARPWVLLYHRVKNTSYCTHEVWSNESWRRQGARHWDTLAPRYHPGNRLGISTLRSSSIMWHLSRSKIIAGLCWRSGTVCSTVWIFNFIQSLVLSRNCTSILKPLSLILLQIFLKNCLSCSSRKPLTVFPCSWAMIWFLLRLLEGSEALLQACAFDLFLLGVVCSARRPWTCWMIKLVKRMSRRHHLLLSPH